jgi:hypothetical protein
MPWNWMQADWPNVRFDSAAVEPRAAGPAVIWRDSGRRPRFTRRKEQLLAHRIAELHHLYRQSRAATTREIQNLVETGALCRTGERRHTR